MRKSALALIALLSLSGFYARVIGQDKSSDDRQWPPLVANSKIIILDGSPRFTIDARKLKVAKDIVNPLNVERCRLPETCWIDVPDFFSKWNGQYGIEKSVLRSEVMMHHYPDVLVNGHNRRTGTYVFFLPKQEIFYLWGDCHMSHGDAVIGPFIGDPRVVLKKLADETSSK